MLVPPSLEKGIITNNMFKDMRRKKQALSEEETLKVLKEGQYGILALLSEDGYPYSIPEM